MCYNASTQRLKQEDHKFETSLCYVVKSSRLAWERLLSQEKSKLTSFGFVNLTGQPKEHQEGKDTQAEPVILIALYGKRYLTPVGLYH